MKKSAPKGYGNKGQNMPMAEPRAQTIVMPKISKTSGKKK